MSSPLLSDDFVQRRADGLGCRESGDKPLLTSTDPQRSNPLFFGLPELRSSKYIFLGVGPIGLEFLVGSQVSQEVEGRRAVLVVGETSGVRSMVGQL